MRFWRCRRADLPRRFSAIRCSSRRGPAKWSSAPTSSLDRAATRSSTRTRRRRRPTRSCWSICPRSRTHELTFAARLINKAEQSLTLNIVGDRTRQVITSWTLPERLNSFEQMPAAFFLGNNSDLGVMYWNHSVRNIDELYADPAKAAQSGAGQAWSRDSVMVNEDGYVVRRSVYGTPNERAIKYVYCKTPGPSGTCLETSNITRIGDANPDFNMSFGLTLNMKRFSVNGLLDWSYGGQLYNGTRQWAFQATRDRVQDQAGKPTNDAACGTVSDPMPSCPQKALPYYGVGFYNGLDPNDYFVESGS